MGLKEVISVKEMTMQEWKKTHKDYKTIINGQRYVLDWVEGKGTSLVPVKIVK
jgi:hypothetical protein